MEQTGANEGCGGVLEHSFSARNPGAFSPSHQPAAWAERRRPGGTVGIACPHCSQPAKIRSSRQQTPLFKELRLQCSNLECGATYVASVTIDREIRPSGTPRRGINLPSLQQSRPANDDSRIEGIAL